MLQTTMKSKHFTTPCSHNHTGFEWGQALAKYVATAQGLSLALFHGQGHFAPGFASYLACSRRSIHCHILFSNSCRDTVIGGKFSSLKFCTWYWSMTTSIVLRVSWKTRLTTDCWSAATKMSEIFRAWDKSSQSFCTSPSQFTLALGRPDLCL